MLDGKLVVSAANVKRGNFTKEISLNGVRFGNYNIWGVMKETVRIREDKTMSNVVTVFSSLKRFIMKKV